MSWVGVILENQSYLVRIEVDEERLTYSMYLTDLTTVWHEEIIQDQFAQRWQNLNSDLEDMEIIDGLREIQHLVNNLNNANIRTVISDTEFNINMDWVSEGLPMYWSISLTKGDANVYNSAVTIPLLSSLSTLLSQRRALSSQLRAKDLELEDLRGGGAVLSLPQLKTDWFDQENFLKHKMGEVVEDPLGFLGGKDIKQVMGMQREVVECVSEMASEGEAITSTVTGPISPTKLSSKRKTTRPDLSKYKNKSDKKSKLNKL